MWKIIRNKLFISVLDSVVGMLSWRSMIYYRLDVEGECNAGGAKMMSNENF